ncbi:MAG: murein biosynthesis integral membrane protein MurJ, partial [Gammaproteobacteria bacterium]|nr:murein biosynthesis integral membrane protein MurJ [Gammaproteobacteria bacterium]
ASLLFFTLKKHGIYRASKGWSLLLMQLFAACFVMLLFLWWAKDDVNTWLAWGAMDRVWNLLWLIFAAGGIYVVFLLIVGVRPWRWKVPVVE